MDTIYIETSIVSYLRLRASSQVVMAARQVLTEQWWTYERANYELVASQFVIDEASAGDPALAAERLRLLDGIPLLPLDPGIARIAAEIMARAILPPKARTDALHIAMVAYHRVQYLLTWNCRHIANAKMLAEQHDGPKPSNTCYFTIQPIPWGWVIMSVLPMTFHENYCTHRPGIFGTRLFRTSSFGRAHTSNGRRG